MWTYPVFEMYLVPMDQLARDDITAAAAAHQELGRDYDGAVAESLIERIGAEIDRRVDARLGQHGDRPGPHDNLGRRDRLAQRSGDGQVSSAVRPSWAVLILALGSMGLGIGAAGAVLSLGNGGAGAYVLVALIWIIIGGINFSYSRRR